ncbi:MAG TPA: serine hydrolase [Clostridia bacterium]
MSIIKKSCARIMASLLAGVILTSGFLPVINAPATANACNLEEKYWPGSSWRTSTPESQGMDSEELSSMFETIKKDKTPIHSVLVIKNGYLVAEAYFDPYDKNEKHALYSATKSFTSTLIGIAIKEGYIKSVNQKVLDFFPDVKVENDQYQVKDMTIENLLTMSSGHKDDSSSALYASKYFPQTFFNLPFDSKPGTKFIYDSGASHLLSMILSKATGVSTEEYAKKHLFDPMKITDYWWETDTNGNYTGGWGLYLTPREMAKFGYLALKNGNWNGKQLVPMEWLDIATKEHIDTYDDGEKTENYGYQWWINSFGGYRADGYGGQYIYVIPQKDLVVVFTAGINYNEQRQPGNYVSDFILPAIKSSRPLPPNPKSVNKLNSITKGLESPKPKKVPALPKTASEISGRTYTMDSEDLSLSFDFKKGNTCTLNLKQNGKDFNLAVGLDDIYRVTEASQVGNMIYYPYYRKVALKGQWINDNTFMMDWHYFEEPFSETYKFTFSGSSVTVEIDKYLPDHTGLSPTHKVLNGTQLTNK